jgi:hypothetical protein
MNFLSKTYYIFLSFEGFNMEEIFLSFILFA